MKYIIVSGSRLGVNVYSVRERERERDELYIYIYLCSERYEDGEKKKTIPTYDFLPRLTVVVFVVVVVVVEISLARLQQFVPVCFPIVNN